MADSLQKLRDKLAELFMMDQADLDFGIFRIMNAKRDEITRFLDQDLLPQVRQILGCVQVAGLQDDLTRAIEQAKGLNMDPDSVPKVSELKAKIAAAGGDDMAQLENEVYSDLYSFFNRYYKDGDFLALRRYKEGVYAIPYEGEEVKLYWANHDQYYIKTGEYLRDYTFKLPDGRRVHFKLREAEEEEHGNVKAAPGEERRFILCETDPLAEETGELVIHFEYRSDPDKRRQDALNAEAAEAIFAAKKFGKWTNALAQKVPTDSNPDRTLLDRHLRTYAARNTFDYFIHKNLGGFLRRELDFFIKNEVLHLDDIQDQPAEHVQGQLRKVKALRTIALKIIAFVAQLEDFQKGLWLKKKFVVETNYCLTLDHVIGIENKNLREELLAEIAANDVQREEWVRLFGIDEIKGDLHTPRYSVPLEVEFLRANPYLVLDTAYYPDHFTDRFLSAIDNVDERCEGLLVHSDNFHALNLLLARYADSVQCIYIDPPYNTGNDEFLYRDEYRSSSWLCMIENRLVLARELLSPGGLLFLQIGDDEEARSRIALESIFSDRKNSVVVRRGVKNVQAQFADIDRLSQGHDTIHVYSKSAGRRVPHLVQRLDAEKPGKWDTFWRGVDRGTMRYEIFGQNPKTGQWRWETNRAYKAKQNYEYFLAKEAKHKGLDEWYAENLQAGTDLDFVRLNDDNVVQYYVPPQGFRLVSDNWLDVSTAGSLTAFPHEKSLELLRRVIGWNSKAGDVVLDFFAGSGSTGHAAISMPPDVSASRRYVQVECSDWFDTELRLRMIRHSYCTEWRDGKPVSRDSGRRHMFKYIRLESYEDALNNLEMRRTADQGKLLDGAENHDLREDYTLRYMLDVESRGSPSLLNVERFRDPFAYQMNIFRNGETRPVNVDLVETFNWLLGLRVHRLSGRITLDAEFQKNKDGLLTVKGGRARKADKGWTFYVVEGTSPQKDRVLVIWRVLTGDAEQDNLMLDTFFQTQGYSTRDLEWDLIYTNGDNNLENLRRTDQTWKVRLIEDEFKKLMFDVPEA